MERKYIGILPQNWSLERLNNVARLYGRIGWQGLTADEYQEKGPWLVTGTDFLNGKVNWASCVHISEKRWEEAWQIKLAPNDLLITKDGTVGKLAIVENMPEKASLNSGIMRVVPIYKDKYSSKYLFYVLQTVVFTEWFKDINAGASTIQHLFQKDFIFPLPPIDEQRFIAAKLETECRRFNRTVATVEKQISILERYRASVIHEAVTHGLDPTVPTKPSGIDWADQIPKNWKIRKLKHTLQSFESGTSVRAASYPADRDEKGVLSLSAVFGGKYNPNANKKIDDDELTRASCPVKSGCLLVSRCNTSEWVGLPAYVETGNPNLYLPDKLWQLDSDSPDINRFIYYSMQSKHARDYCAVMSVGSSPSMQNIASFDLLNMFIVLPSVEKEAKGIADYLDARTAAIDAVLDTKRKQLDVLKRRRQSLIYEYVTGKRRINEEA